jgi:hypothetical protein
MRDWLTAKLLAKPAPTVKCGFQQFCQSIRSLAVSSQIHQLTITNHQNLKAKSQKPKAKSH